MKNKMGYLAIGLIITQFAIIFISWIIDAIHPNSNLNSLLNEEGIRWLFRSFTTNLKSEFLVWIVLYVSALGAFQVSSLQELIVSLIKRRVHWASLEYRQKVGMQLVVLLLILFSVVFVFLTAIPKAILLNITGSLSISTLILGVIPLFSFIMVVISLSYGIIVGKIKNVGDMLHTVSIGFQKYAYIFPFYILLTEFYYIVHYIFYPYLYPIQVYTKVLLTT